MRVLFRWILERPRLVLGLCLAVTLAFGSGILRLVQDTSIEAFLPRGDASYTDKKLIDRTYGIGDPIILGVEDLVHSDVFNAEALALVERLSAFLEALPGVKAGSVRSLATAKDLRAAPEGPRLERFLDAARRGDAAADEVRRRVLAFPLYLGLLVSLDHKAAMIVADVRENEIVPVFREVRRTLDRQIDPQRFRVRFSGPPVVAGTLSLYMNRDALVLNPTFTVVAVALLYWFFRAWVAVALPFVVVLPAAAWVLGAMGHLGAPFTPLSNAIPAVVFVLAMSDTIYIQGTYYDYRLAMPDKTPREVLEELLVALWRPITWTSLTNAAGFLTLMVSSPLVFVHDFGLAAGIASMAENVLALSALPAAIAWIEPKIPQELIDRRQSGNPRGLDRALLGLHGLVTAHPLAAVAPVAAIVLLAAIGVSKLRIDYDKVELFPRRSEVYRDTREIGRRFAGANVADLHVDSGRADGIFDPAFLGEIDLLESEIERWEEVGKTVSIVQIFKKLNQVAHGDDSRFYRLPGDGEWTKTQLSRLAREADDAGALGEFVSPDLRSAHVRVLLRSGQYVANRPFFDWLTARLADAVSSRRVVLGGEAYVDYHWMRSIGRSVLESVVVMLGGMLVAGAVLMGGLRIAALLILPVTIAVAATYGIMGFLGIPIGLTTSIVASVALGMGVDYAIQYLFRYRRERLAGHGHSAASLTTLTTTGKQIIGNAALVVCGFLTLLVAKTTPPGQMGIFVAVGVAGSMVTTLLVLGVLARFIPAPASMSPESSADAVLPE